MIQLTPLTSSSKAESDQEVSEEQGWFHLFLLDGLHSPFSCRTSKWDCQKCPWNTLPVLARQKVQAKAPVCGLSTAVYGLLKKFPWCARQSAAKKEGKHSKIHQGSNLWKTSTTRWCFPKTFCTVISSLNVRSIPCSPSVQLALHTSTDSLCSSWSDFPRGNSCLTVRYYCPITLQATLMWASGSGTECKSAVHPLQSKITQVSLGSPVLFSKIYLLD